MRLKPIAFYLPQFHPIAVNDRNWGPGFTEWNNVVKARPRFPGHIQPKYPGKLGFYDLRAREVFEDQVDIARHFGVYGFCFYYYRFGAQRVLEAPLELLGRARSIPMPYCFCWANENWTRAWDGRTSDVLLEQTYDDAALHGLLRDLRAAFADERYIRVDRRPVFMIYQVEHIPSYADWLDRLRSIVRADLGEDVLLGAVFSHGCDVEAVAQVDFLVQFPPHRMPRRGPRALVDAQTVKPFEPQRQDHYEEYDAVVREALDGIDLFPHMMPGVCPDWDNTPRRDNSAHTLIGSTPQKFEQWVERAGRYALASARDGRLQFAGVFVNAWNEWAEGAMLEPTERGGTAYLSALKAGIVRAEDEMEPETREQAP